MGGGNSKKKKAEAEKKVVEEKEAAERAAAAERYAAEQALREQQELQQSLEQNRIQKDDLANNQQENSAVFGLRGNVGQQQQIDKGNGMGKSQKKQQMNRDQDEKEEFELSRELGEFAANTVKGELDFGEEISAIYSDEDVESSRTLAERIINRIQQVNLLKNFEQSVKPSQRLGWPAEGSCEVMTVKFKVIYSHSDCDLKIASSYNYYASSTMSWHANIELQAYEFEMKDNAVYNTITGDKTSLQNNAISFIVSPLGDFVCIKEEHDFVKNFRKNQHVVDQRTNGQDEVAKLKAPPNMALRSPIKRIKKDEIIQHTENSMKQIWQQSVLDFQEFKKVDEGEAQKKKKKKKKKKNVDGDNGVIEGSAAERALEGRGGQGEDEMIAAEEVVVSRGENIATGAGDQIQQNQQIMFNGYECEVVEKSSYAARENMEDYLRERLSSEKSYFDTCFTNGKKVVRDKLKLWDIVDDQTELMPSRFRFPVLRKHDSSSGIVEQLGSFLRPHVLKQDTCRLVVIDHKRDLFVDVVQELKLLVFLWPDKDTQHNDNAFYEQLGRFKEDCDDALKLITLDLSRVRALPVSFKPKLKKKYFELY